MRASSIVIVSPDADFSGVLAEHARRELALDVQVVDTADKAKTLEAQLIITSEALAETFVAPVLLVDEKPIVLQNLLERIRAQLAQESFPLGEAVFSVQQKTITHGQKNISLTDKETQLLLLLLKNGAKGVTKETLLKEVWGVSNELESHTLETHIYRLRAKLKEADVAATILAGPGKYSLSL